MPVDYTSKLLRTLARTKEKVVTQSRQRRGGVTDLYALDYVSEISNGIVGGGADPLFEEGDSDNTLSRIKQLTIALMRNIDNVTANGVAGIVGNFGIETDVKAKRYEADFATGYQYDKVAQEPTAEHLMGSWGAFLGLYGGGGLNEEGYLVDKKHWIGIGLGQWTGARSKALYDYAQNEGKSIYSFDTQIKFMLREDKLSDIVKRVATSLDSVENTTQDFLDNWEGVPGNKLAQRIAYAKNYVSYIQEVLTDPDNGGDGIDDVVDTTPSKNNGESIHRVLIPGDIDRFQRWFIKVLVSNHAEVDSGINVIPIMDAHMSIYATNSRTGQSMNLDITPILKHKYPCDWIGSQASAEAVYPSDSPMEGYDMMDLAWYLNNEQRDILYSPGEKIFTIKAFGTARITLRNFIKFSHIN